MSITSGIVSSKIYDKWDGFNFEIVNFSFLDRDVPHCPSLGVYMSQLIRFARICSCYDIKLVRKEEGKFYWKIPLGDDDATREK